jgi:hypothetical protein
MAPAFKIFRILCSTPPELEPERCIFESSLAAFGTEVTFPEQILFAGASFRESFDANRHRSAAESNVRMCDFFLQILGEEWPGAVFQGFVDLAVEVMADPSKPMRQVTVIFRNLAAAGEKVRQFPAEGRLCRLVCVGSADALDSSPAILRIDLSEFHAASSSRTC